MGFFDSDIVQQEAKQLFEDYQSLVQVGSSYGKFERIIPLPVQVKTDAAQAEYKNGILTLNLPKSEQEKKKVVKVEVK